MQRSELEHIVRASAAITGVDSVVIIGSQAVLGQFPDAPAELLRSEEADVFTFRSPEDAVLIEGSIGEGSPFHQTFGYYAHGIEPEVAVLPTGWRDRLVAIRNSNTGTGAGLCLEIHDLAVSKLIAGREKDAEFVASLLRHRMIDPKTIRQRLDETVLDTENRNRIEARLIRASIP